MRTVDYPSSTLADYGVAALKIAIFGVLLALLWWLVNRATRFDDHEELFVKRNAPYVIQRCGLLLGQGLAMWPLLGSGDSFAADIGWLLGGGLWAIAVLGLLWPVLDRIVGKGETTDPTDPVERSTSIVRAAFFVATGLVIGAGLSGSAPTVALGIASTLVFTSLGLVVLCFAYLVNGRVSQFDRLSQHIAQGNVAAGIIAGGFTVALGVVLNKAIAGDFVGWGSSLLGFTVTAVVAVVGFYVVSWLLDRFIITSATLRQVVQEDQKLAATVTAAVLVTVAVGVAALSV
ncbi:MAG TPA: DUF350 domain-containing protein [Micromonosporaceae bacterium]|jgi:uncharacterized membrane protein YjfL (UPF0719 family)|nr:DUF350 domain-containing protein [Micromonosporaceae bacterium]